MRTYPSKLLLFGEHILLLGSTALALPLPAFGGKWVENGTAFDADLLQKLMLFASSDALKRVDGLDSDAFYKELQHGLVFESNIPMGYGLGSSGALCAAVYDRYCLNKTADLTALKAVFSGMESFFHGASSGIDPLVSYIGKPLLIHQKTEVSLAGTTPWEHPPVVFLLDSALPRQTAPLVRWFLEQTEKADFAAILKRNYLPAHEAMVQSWLTANAEDFWINLRRVSDFQLKHFDPMIPATMRELWAAYMDNQQILFKICGAGGGGFFLGFSSNDQAVQKLAKQYPIVFPFTTSI